MDKIIRQIIHRIFSCMEGAPEEERLQQILKKQMAGNQAIQKKITFNLEKDREQLKKLQLEIGKTLTGDSIYSSEDLTVAIKALKERIETGEQRLLQVQTEAEERKRGIESISLAYNQFKSWADEFDTATIEQQKMIACQLFKRIEVGRDYNISVELNMTYQQFCSEWEKTNECLSAI